MLKQNNILSYLSSSLILLAVDKVLLALPATSSLRFDMAGFKKEKFYDINVNSCCFFTFGKENKMAAEPCAHPECSAHTVEETSNERTNALLILRI